MGGKQYREDRTTGEAIIERVSGEFKRADGEDTKKYLREVGTPVWLW